MFFILAKNYLIILRLSHFYEYLSYFQLTEFPEYLGYLKLSGEGAIAKKVCSLIKCWSLIMTISFPNRNDKLASQIRDGLRILAWQEYKNDNESDLKGLELYALFKEEWEVHEIQKMNLNKLQKFISELGYSQSDIAQIRGDYYRSRNEYKANNSVNNNSEELETAPF